MKTLLLTMLAILASGAMTPNANADDSTDANRAEARERLAHGLRLFDAGDNGGAMAEFKRVYELIPSKPVLLNIGLVYAAMDRPVEAVDTLGRVLGEPGPLKPEQVARAQEVKAAQERRIGFLAVKSNAPADISVDGILVGRTPLAAPIRVSSGTHRVEAAAPGFLSVRKETLVAGGLLADVSFVLQPTEVRLAHVEVRCTTPGADLLVDGAPAGKTPLAKSLALAPGVHAIEVKRQGYLSQRREMNLADGSRSEVHFELEEDPSASSNQGGRLSLVVHEEGVVQVTVDGRSRGAYLAAMALPVGPHQLRLERAGFEPSERTIDISAGCDTVVSADLRATVETHQAYHAHVRSYHTWAYSALISGVVIGAGAGVLTMWSGRKLSTANADLAQVQSDWQRYAGGSCDHSLALSDPEISQCNVRLSTAQDEVSKYRSIRMGGLVGASVGAVLLGTGIALVLLRPEATRYDEKGDKSVAVASQWLPTFSVNSRGADVWLCGRF